MKRFRVGWKAALADVVAISFRCARNLGAKVGTLPSEFRFVTDSESNEIVKNQNLSVAIGSGADADGWDLELVGNAGGDFARHGFQHDGKCSRRFDGSRVAFELARSVSGFALHVESAQSVDRLRGEADVAHHRNFGFDQTRD